MTHTLDLNNQTRSLTDMMALVHGTAPLPGFGAQPSTTAARVSSSAAGPATNGKKPRAKKNSNNSLPKNKDAMKHITTVDGKDGNVSYRVQIRRQKDGKATSICETFPDYNSAKTWRDDQLTTISAKGLSVPKSRIKTVSAVIQYRKDKHNKEVERTTTQVLNFLQAHPFGQTPVRDLTEEKLIEFAEGLIATGMRPQTAATYMTILAYTLKWARRRKVAVPPNVVEEAMQQLWEDEVLERSVERERVADRSELDKIFALRVANKRQKLPLVTITIFALFSTRRLGEICRLRWDDLNVADSMILVRKMKHPRKKKRYDRWVKLTPEALAIIQAMPRVSEFIFPYNPRSLGTAFRRHCKTAEIEDLHFHDLRHSGITRLFELGETAPFVMLYSGHKKSDTLDRYTHVEKRQDRFSDWEWLAKVLAACVAGSPI
ncbi:MAG: site-specific integrase [Paracoccaceae bacterium]